MNIQAQTTVQNSSPISFERNTHPKKKPDPSQLGFGKYFTDHMFVTYYNPEKGWHDPKVIPYQSFPMDPGASVLHYGQALFEGMKAFRNAQGECVLFRPEYNWQRMKDGAERLCLQAPPLELFIEGIRALIHADIDWLPSLEQASLYIRPTLIGTEAFLGVRPANEVMFFVILSPVGSYYSTGIEPVRIWVEQKYLRAAPGGLGATKAAANYAGSLKAALEAKQKNCAQVLWLDIQRKYVEEVGTMNVFFVFENEIVTPVLDGTILAGGTRDSLIQLLKESGRPLVERKVTLDEILEGAKSGQLKEAFGSGTAAVVTPIGELVSENFNLKINDGATGPVAQGLYKELAAIQRGLKPDTHRWMMKV